MLAERQPAPLPLPVVQVARPDDGGYATGHPEQADGGSFAGPVLLPAHCERPKTARVLDIKGDIGRQFGIQSLPTTFILDGQGGIIGKAFGPREWDSKESVDFFEHLIALEKD